MARIEKECDPLKVNFRDKKTEALQDEISSLGTHAIGRAMSRTQEYCSYALCTMVGHFLKYS